ncbi:hypothetical protein IEN85_21420 [Pelagicoccus sp. NFK12]|uniref:TVP38/TMEM64 family membrane protein n=1 Tax=Pelagicoccus enzymogenes TaxID=2773457 RepID=A0A927FES6_9BACT|nr:hypothetical protein [Pelagicoccus enzymogenes]MBD5782073.1 hypothetical protein [Pelagicoccus enzymogenes]MDQ8196827.1 hypothetical protein [Pelagicoccus enzymogenes]
MKGLRFKLAVIVALSLLAVVGGAVLWRYREFVNREQLMALVESFAAMGPWVFFSLMAVLPLFWMPLSPFLILAPAFGIETAIFGSACALSFNVVISWFVSGKWFRPIFERVVNRFGYSVPDIPAKRMVGFALLLRITPGMPFPLQNYLLGLARMPLGQYLAVSLPIIWIISSSLIVLGESIMSGNGRLALLGIFLAVLVALAFRYWRSRLEAKTSLQNGDAEA